MIRLCRSCGGEFEAAADYHRLCWTCWREQHRDRQQGARQASERAAYTRGYAAGYRDALGTSSSALDLQEVGHLRNEQRQAQSEVNVELGKLTAAVQAIKDKDLQAEATAAAKRQLGRGARTYVNLGAVIVATGAAVYGALT